LAYCAPPGTRTPNPRIKSLYARELLADSTGAVGYLLKDRVSNVAQFVDAVRRVAAWRHRDGPRSSPASWTGRPPPNRWLHVLTAREREVLGLMADGRSNAAIAGRLLVTEKADPVAEFQSGGEGVAEAGEVAGAASVEGVVVPPGV
jgi:hypothetical protein